MPNYKPGDIVEVKYKGEWQKATLAFCYDHPSYYWRVAEDCFGDMSFAPDDIRPVQEVKDPDTLSFVQIAAAIDASLECAVQLYGLDKSGSVWLFRVAKKLKDSYWYPLPMNKAKN